MSQSKGVGKQWAEKVETKGIEPVCDDERRGSVKSVFSLWFAGNIQYSALVVGAITTAFLKLSLVDAVIGLTIGTVVGSILLAFAATMGPRAGATQMIQSRGPFGYFGNFIPALLLTVTGIGYFAVNTVLGAYIVVALVSDTFSVGTFTVSLIALTVLQVLIAIVGHDLVHRVERWMFFIMATLFLILSWYGFAHASYIQSADAVAVAGGMSLAIALASTRTFAWSIGASDYTRYLPASTSRRSIFTAGFLGACVSGLWMHILGAAIGTLIFPQNPADLVTHLVPSGLSTIVLIALLCSTIAGSLLDVYSGSLSLLVADVRLRRWASAILVGVLGSALGWWAGRFPGGGVFHNFQNFLFLMGYWIGPWLGIILAEYFVIKGIASQRAVFYDRSRKIHYGLWAWLAGLVISIPFMNQTLFVGAMVAAYPGLGDITYWVGGVSAAIVYITICYVVRARCAGAGDMAVKGVNRVG